MNFLLKFNYSRPSGGAAFLLFLVNDRSHSPDLAVDFIFQSSGGHEDFSIFRFKIRFLRFAHFCNQVKETFCVHVIFVLFRGLIRPCVFRTFAYDVQRAVLRPRHLPEHV